MLRPAGFGRGGVSSGIDRPIPLGKKIFRELCAMKLVELMRQSSKAPANKFLIWNTDAAADMLDPEACGVGARWPIPLSVLLAYPAGRIRFAVRGKIAARLTSSSSQQLGKSRVAGDQGEIGGPRAPLVAQAAVGTCPKKGLGNISPAVFSRYHQC